MFEDGLNLKVLTLTVCVVVMIVVVLVQDGKRSFGCFARSRKSLTSQPNRVNWGQTIACAEINKYVTSHLPRISSWTFDAFLVAIRRVFTKLFGGM